MAVASPPDPGDIGVPPEALVLLAVTAGAIYVSSLVDWYIILPRMSGLLGARPCRPGDGEPPRFPHTWREVTRWWYVHRIAAALVVRFGLGYAVTFTVAEHVDLGSAERVVGGLALGFLGSYIAAVPRAAFQAGRPTVVVGRTVRRRRSERKPLIVFRFLGRSWRVPGLRRVPQGPAGEREYVFDVGLEGVHLVPVEPYEARPPDDEPTFEKDPRTVRLSLLPLIEPEKERSFTGCNESCSGINWYCIENPRCFESK